MIMSEQKTNKEIFEEAISCNYAVSMTNRMNQDTFGHEHVITNNVFYDVNKVEGCQFSLTGIPGESGFHVRISGVKLMPATYTGYAYLPKWLKVILRFLGAKEI